MLETLRSSAPKAKEFNDEEKGEFINDPYHISNTSSSSPSAQRRSSYDRNASRSPNSKDNAEEAKKQWIKTSPYSPRNWSSWRKWWVISGLLFYTFIVFIVSTGLVTDYYKEEFGVSTEVAILGQSMFIAGVAVGPMFLAPLSEIYGRQPVYTTGILLFALLQIPTALTPTFAGLAITRFITGCVAGLPISNVGATSADLFSPSQTAWPISLFSAMSQAIGPDIGPTIGSAIYVQLKSLNWLYWTILIFGMLNFVWSLTFSETLHDKVYQKHTGAKIEKSAGQLVGKELFRAFKLLFTDPIVIALALTTTYLFGLIFIYLQGYPLVYQPPGTYNFNALQEATMFLPGVGGALFALATQPLQNYMYRRSASRTSNGKPLPEARLYTACFAVWALPISVFWFAFTSTHPEISYQIPMWSGFLFGYAETAVYTGIWQYVTDAYGEHAGSALAGCNLPANGISAGLAHASIPMFANEGTKWALATLGFISLGFLFVPPLLVWKGAALRKRSKYAVSSAGGKDD